MRNSIPAGPLRLGICDDARLSTMKSNNPSSVTDAEKIDHIRDSKKFKQWKSFASKFENHNIEEYYGTVCITIRSSNEQSNAFVFVGFCYNPFAGTVRVTASYSGKSNSSRGRIVTQSAAKEWAAIINLSFVDYE